MRLKAYFAVLFLLTGCGGEPPASMPTKGVVELSEQFVGDFELVDKTGVVRTDEEFEGKIMLVYFGFTHCPDVCPGDVGVMSATLNELGEDADEVAAVFISVDPERDTPEALSEYFAFDERIVPLTGTPEAAKAARDSFKLFAQKEELPDSALGYTVNHGRFFYITDRNGQPKTGVVGGINPEDLAALLRHGIANS